MKRVLVFLAKVVGALIASFVLFVIVVINFGTVETRLVCAGEVKRTVGSEEPVTTAATLYARVETYRWFILWVDHDAMIFWEVQPGNHNRFGYYSTSSFATNITDLNGAKAYGSFSSLSNRIYLLTSVDETEAFAGTCKNESQAGDLRFS